MPQKFKMTTYSTLLLIGLFVLSYAVNIAYANAENYNCSGSTKKVEQCLKAVISQRDATIEGLRRVLHSVEAAEEDDGRWKAGINNIRRGLCDELRKYVLDH
jgi:hypothetical protein